MTPEQQLEMHKKIYERGNPATSELSDKLEPHYVKSLFITTLYELRMYQGRKIHGLHNYIKFFCEEKKYLDNMLKKVNKQDITFSELKKINPIYYYQLVGNHLYVIKNKKHISEFLRI